MEYLCDNCGSTDAPALNLNEVAHLAIRIDPGGIVPAGQCRCGSFTYLVPDSKAQDPARLAAAVDGLMDPPYSVLLAYNPAECEDSKVVESYFAHARASTPEEAVIEAQRQMYADNKWEWDDDAEARAVRARPLLCLAGHHVSHV